MSNKHVREELSQKYKYQLQWPPLEYSSFLYMLRVTFHVIWTTKPVHVTLTYRCKTVIEKETNLLHKPIVHI